MVISHPLDLEQQLCFALYSTSRLLVRAYRPLLDRLSITYPQYLVLIVLWQVDRAGEEPPTVRTLGSRLHLDSGTLTPLLKRMESRGLITRQRSAHDEREVHVVLSEEGRRLSKDAESVPEAIGCVVGMDEGDVVELRDRLHDLLDRLGAHT
ncbi:MAG: MarR family transcriptional regulator [Myxococcota bacterium]